MPLTRTLYKLRQDCHSLRRQGAVRQLAAVATSYDLSRRRCGSRGYEVFAADAKSPPPLSAATPPVV